MHQLFDPVTCGLNGFNPVTGEFGNCSRQQIERREDYVATGQAVCELSRTPVVGTFLPDSSRQGAATYLAENWFGALLGGAESGLKSLKDGSPTAVSKAVGATGSALTRVSAAASVVDIACRIAEG